MEDYFEAKAKLFTSNHALRAVVNADDPWGRLLLDRGKIPMTAVHHADAGDVVLRPGHTEFTWRGHRVATPLTGGVNVDNALLAAEAALVLDLELEPAEIAAAMAHLRPVPGRLQVIAAPAAADAVAPSGRLGTGGARGAGDAGGGSDSPGRRSPSWSTTPTRRQASRSCWPRRASSARVRPGG